MSSNDVNQVIPDDDQLDGKTKAELLDIVRSAEPVIDELVCVSDCHNAVLTILDTVAGMTHSLRCAVSDALASVMVNYE